MSDGIADAHAVGETERASLFEALERSRGALTQSEDARVAAELFAKETQQQQAQLQEKQVETQNQFEQVQSERDAIKAELTAIQTVKNQLEEQIKSVQERLNTALDDRDRAQAQSHSYRARTKEAEAQAIAAKEALDLAHSQQNQALESAQLLKPIPRFSSERDVARLQAQQSQDSERQIIDSAEQMRNVDQRNANQDH